MKKSRRWQFILFLFITIVLAITLALKAVQSSNDSTVITANTFIPKLIKNKKISFQFSNHSLYLLAIPSVDVILEDAKTNKLISKTDTSTLKEDTNSPNIPYDYIALIDKNMNVVLEASDTYVENSELGIIDKDVPLILGQHSSSKKNKNTKNENYTYGVYDLQNNKWLISRKYSYIDMVGKDYYCAFDKDNIPYLYNKKGNLVLKDISIDSGTTYKIVGNHIVVLNKNSTSVTIYTKEGVFVSTINSEYVNLYRKYIVAGSSNQDAIIYDENGASVFTKDTILKNSNIPLAPEDLMTIYQFNEDSNFVEVQMGHYFIISTLDGTIIKVLDQSKEPENNLGLVSNGYFTYSTDLSSLSFYDQNGKKYITSDNNDYTDFVEPGYYYYYKDKKIELYDYTNKKSLKLNASKLSSPYLSAIHNNFTFVFSHDDENSVLIFYKEKLVYEGKQSYIELINNYIVVTNVTKNNTLSKKKNTAFTPYSAYMDSLHTIFNPEGKKIYESKEKEKILSIDSTYIQIMRDNSIGITNYNGNFLCKINLTAK